MYIGGEKHLVVSTAQSVKNMWKKSAVTRLCRNNVFVTQDNPQSKL